MFKLPDQDTPAAPSPSPIVSDGSAESPSAAPHRSSSTASADSPSAASTPPTSAEKTHGKGVSELRARVAGLKPISEQAQDRSRRRLFSGWGSWGRKRTSGMVRDPFVESDDEEGDQGTESAAEGLDKVVKEVNEDWGGAVVEQIQQRVAQVGAEFENGEVVWPIGHVSVSQHSEEAHVDVLPESSKEARFSGKMPSQEYVIQNIWPGQTLKDVEDEISDRYHEQNRPKISENAYLTPGLESLPVGDQLAAQARLALVQKRTREDKMTDRERWAINTLRCQELKAEIERLEVRQKAVRRAAQYVTEKAWFSSHKKKAKGRALVYCAPEESLVEADEGAPYEWYEPSNGNDEEETVGVSWPLPPLLPASDDTVSAPQVNYDASSSVYDEETGPERCETPPFVQETHYELTRAQGHTPDDAGPSSSREDTSSSAPEVSAQAPSQATTAPGGGIRSIKYAAVDRSWTIQPSMSSKVPTPKKTITDGESIKNVNSSREAIAKPASIASSRGSFGQKKNSSNLIAKAERR